MSRSQNQTNSSQPGSSSNTNNNRKRSTTGANDSTSSSNFVYNPRQSDSDRRTIRSSYRTLILQAEQSKRDFSTLKPTDLLSLLNKADELHEKVVAPSESILDTKTLSSMSEMGARMAKKMKLNSDAFNTNEFVEKLARFVDGEALPIRSVRGDEEDSEEEEEEDNCSRWNWGKLSQLATSLSHRSPTIDFLLGPLKIESRTRKVIVQRSRNEEVVEKTVPRSLQQTDLALQNSNQESTTAILRVAQLLKQQGEKGVCLFKFAVDPESFGNTVENFFHVSFLIKENKARLRTGEDGEVRLIIANPPREGGEEEEEEDEGEEEEEGGKGKAKQFIMEIDYSTYLETIELYNIKQSLIPTRRNRVDSLAGRDALNNVTS